MSAPVAAPASGALLDALACGTSGCACAGAARRGQGLTHCPAHPDRTPSLSVRAGEGTVLVYCQAGCDQPRVLDALRARGLWHAPPERNGAVHHPASPARTVRYVYRAEGRVLATHVRREVNGSKRMWWETAQGTTSRGDVKPEALPLYGLEDVLARPDATVVLVEGEKARDEAAARGLVAATLAGGASQTDFGAALDVLQGRKVMLWPDNDAPGLALMQRVAAALEGQARSVRWLVVPGLPQKGDAADYFAAGRTVEELRGYVADSPPALVVEDARSAEQGAQAPDGRACAPVLVRLADVRRERVRWLWPGRIPLSKPTLIEGDPGLGKSLATLDLAARVSRGQAMPDATTSDLDGPAGVVLLSAEDGLADTVRPRLEDAGADLARVVALTALRLADDERPPTLAPADLVALEAAIGQVDARLVVVDPLMAYLPADTNSHRDQDVRRVLAPLAALAERTGAAVLVVRHLNKSGGGSPLYRGGGSIGIVAAVRSALLVARDPDDATGERRILAPMKCNLTVPPPALAYRIVASLSGAPVVRWEGPTNHSAARLLAVGEADTPDERSALDDAVDVLRRILADGPVPAEAAKQQARAAGVADRTVFRAKARLGVQSRKAGMDAGWTWELPKIANDAEGCQPPGDGNLQEVWQPSAASAEFEVTL